MPVIEHKKSRRCDHWHKIGQTVIQHDRSSGIESAQKNSGRNRKDPLPHQTDTAFVRLPDHVDENNRQHDPDTLRQRQRFV